MSTGHSQYFEDEDCYFEDCDEDVIHPVQPADDIKSIEGISEGLPPPKATGRLSRRLRTSKKTAASSSLTKTAPKAKIPSSARGLPSLKAIRRLSQRHATGPYPKKNGVRIKLKCVVTGKMKDLVVSRKKCGGNLDVVRHVGKLCSECYMRGVELEEIRQMRESWYQSCRN